MNRIIVCVGVLSILLGCAGQRPPEGGPPDTQPPEIISVYPAPNTVRYQENSIVLEFSEYVDRRSVQDAIFISPPVGQVEYDWSGTEVEINFLDSLKQNTTYVITVGTDVVDVNNRNKMAKAFPLAFSTGDKIDIGEIQGKVVDPKPEGVMIFSYRLDGLLKDTLNPMNSKPDFVTQSGKDGSFSLTNLSSGLYRLFAIRDEYKNFLYDPETDAVGTITEDIRLTDRDTLYSGVQFTLAKEDTTSPRLVNVVVPDINHLEVTFSEKIDTSALFPKQFTITDTIGISTIGVLGVFPSLSQVGVTVLTTRQQPDSLYYITISGIKDEEGHTINELSRQKMFSGVSVSDSAAPAIVYASLPDSGASINTTDSILIIFSDAVSRPLPANTIGFRRIRDSAVVDFSAQWSYDAWLKIRPRSPLKFNELYSLTVNMKNISDLFKNRHKDTIRSFTFKTFDPEQFGSIEGRVLVPDFSTAVVVEAENIERKNDGIKKVRMKKDRTFFIPNLTDGKYVIRAFDDINEDGKHFSGIPFPFRRAEKIRFYADTIKVRARWPVEGVIIR